MPPEDHKPTGVPEDVDARVISEREVSKGLRRKLTTEARRLGRLATERYNEIRGKVFSIESGEEV